MDTAIFGDVGAHSQPFFSSLDNLGVNLDTGEIPKDLQIVQLGDLIHKGPDSDLIVETVNRIMNNSPDQWVQLAGNHELQHCNGRPCVSCYCSHETIQTIRNWWENKQLNIAARIQHKSSKLLPREETLITHAGVTLPVFLKAEPATLKDWVHWANMIAREQLIRAAGKLYGFGTNWNAGPIWALCIDEVYASWQHDHMPFNQIHGHTAPFVWYHSQWFNVPNEWREKIKLHR